MYRTSDAGPAAPARARRRGRALALAGVLALLAGCGSPPPATPPLARPVLERPVGRVYRDAQERLYVPAEAVVQRGGIPGVFVLQPPAPFPPPATGAGGETLAHARFRMIRPGRTVRERVEVLAGLAGDERLVLGSLRDVLDGSPIVAVAGAAREGD